MKKSSIILLAAFALPLMLLSCSGGEELSVVSFNMRQGIADDGPNSWEFRKEASSEMINTEKPLIFGVQEALWMQLEYLEKTCPDYACIGVGRDDGKDEGEHMSIYYRKDAISLEDWGTYWLSETPEVPSLGWDAACRRTATWALMTHKASGHKFFYVNTHLDHVGKVARREGLRLLVERIAAMNPEGYPMVLTGDFNVTPDDPCLEDLDKMMSSARAVAQESDTTGSYNDWGERDDIIDYIYFSGFSSCRSFKVLNSPYAGVPYISDHYPVMARLKFCNSNSKKGAAEQTPAPRYTEIENPCVSLSEFPQDAEGYYLIFDGTSLKGWRGYGKDCVPERWTLKDGCLHFQGADKSVTEGGGDIMFSHKFKNFILEFEWMVEKGSNSGVFYLAREISAPDAEGKGTLRDICLSAPEYQILDNANHPDALKGVDGNRQSASLYDMVPAKPQNFTGWGKWQSGSIMVDNGAVTHCQNGEKVLEYRLWTPQWTQMLQNSKFSREKWPLAFELLSSCGGKNHEGYIAFQDHRNDVWFRNVRIKVLD